MTDEIGSQKYLTLAANIKTLSGTISIYSFHHFYFLTIIAMLIQGIIFAQHDVFSTSPYVLFDTRRNQVVQTNMVSMIMGIENRIGTSRNITNLFFC